MIIKVCGNDFCCHIICWMLNWRESINFLSMRQNNNSAWMLSGRPSNANTALRDSIDFAFSLDLAMLIKILLYISIGCLLGQCSHSSCTESMSLSKNNFSIIMSFWLIFSRKIQVNIRLFVSLKSQKSFKWNIKAILF